MPEATKTRLSINRRIRELFLNFPRVHMTKAEIRQRLFLPHDTEITARIREIRNHPIRPMDIKCERRKGDGKTIYEYVFYPAQTLLSFEGEQLPLSTEKS
jgi:hypothetical protein